MIFRMFSLAASGAVLPWMAAQVPAEMLPAALPAWVLPVITAVAPLATFAFVIWLRIRSRQKRAMAELDKAYARQALSDGDPNNDAAGHAALARATLAEAEADAIDSELRNRGHASATPVATPASTLEIIASIKKPPGAQ